MLEIQQLMIQQIECYLNPSKLLTEFLIDNNPFHINNHFKQTIQSARSNRELRSRPVERSVTISTQSPVSLSR